MKTTRRKPSIKTARAAPCAAQLMESMRDLGYTLEGALADVIDNSIAAGARQVRILADTSAPEQRLAIVDDGCGMSKAQLLAAMRPGARSPLDARASQDLGRFGLGLKTASLSQCRRLTVVSRKAGKTAAACWDLDYVARVDDWLVQIPADLEEIPWIEQLGKKGTLVLWECLDRLTDNDSGGAINLHLNHRLDEAVDHLQLVFHRYLAGEKGLAKVAISLNNRELEPFDPFQSGHSATIAGPVERIRVRGGEVVIQAFTLPHHTKVSTKEWELFGGRAGYLRNQGFYVYRCRRLIIHGTWFNLARQMELTKLARVRIDLPNDLDEDWKVDVRKSSAQPPRQVRERLRQIIEAIGAGSKRVYTSRGRRLISESRMPVWQRVQDKGEIRYRLNFEHPSVVDFSSRLDGTMKKKFLNVLELAAAALPIDALFADIGAQPERVTGDGMSPEALEQAVVATFRHLVKAGLPADAVVAMLRSTEPFRSSWSQCECMVACLQEEAGSRD